MPRIKILIINLMKMFRIVFIACIFTIVTGNSTSVQRCERGDLPINTYIEGCVGPPCQLVQGEDAVIHVVFKSPRIIRRLRTQAIAMLFINYDLGEHAETCNHLTNTYCPILKDEVVQYTLRMFILPIFPTIPALVDFRVVDSENNILWCIRTTVQIIAPSNSRSIQDNSRMNGTNAAL